MDATTLRFHSANLCLPVTVLQSIHSPPATHLWPSSLVLARLVWSRLVRENQTLIVPNTSILELGCGTGLPGLLISAWLSATQSNQKHIVKVIQTDLNPKALSLVKESHEKMSSKDCQYESIVFPLSWSSTTEPSHPCLTDESFPISLILCADVFYDRVEFDPLVATIASILDGSSHPDPVCLMTYHERSSKRCIQHLLDKWGLEAVEISMNSFGVVDGCLGPSVEYLNQDKDVILGEGISVDGVEEGQEAGAGWGPGLLSVYACIITIKKQLT
ncbi:hypothetical protein BDR26DRAFT_834079 [Obelidium mucronatum]|nr:hypothetical protein BDR26DRAFT_834079 [Obelidium mucronatum]